MKPVKVLSYSNRRPDPHCIE